MIGIVIGASLFGLALSVMGWRVSSVLVILGAVVGLVILGDLAAAASDGPGAFPGAFPGGVWR